MDGIISLIASVLVIIMIVVYFKMANNIKKIRRFIEWQLDTRNKAVSKVIMNSADKKESVFEYLTSYTNYIEYDEGNIELDRKLRIIKKENRQLIEMAEITDKELENWGKLI